ncbi:SEL1-like repeat protein [Archangium sp.]|jgi:hypothetical protein|uniref:SEL1-like repeat protein n=1 Tax=Archangium sp. TaxID=1872627 RepID=UPI002EDB8CBC
MRRWAVAGLGCAWVVVLSGCALLRREDPQRPLVDKIRPAALGSFGSGETERVPPPETEVCTVATARQCYERGMAFASGRGVQKDPIQAVSLLSKACNGHVREACETLSLRLKKPERLGSRPPRSGATKPVPFEKQEVIKLHCRLVEPGVPRNCQVVVPVMGASRRERILSAVSSFRYKLPTFDGEAFESDYLITFDIEPE